MEEGEDLNSDHDRSSGTHNDGRASWNPALRPDVLASSTADQSFPSQDIDDDFYDRYPGATPEKSRNKLPGASLEPSLNMERRELFRRSKDYSVQPVKDATLPNGIHSSAEIDDGVIDGGEHSGTTPDDTVPLVPEPEEPAIHYEHQSEVTAMDEAVDESAEAPLMEDEQPEPEVALLADSMVQEQSSHPPPAPGRSFTTNFTTSDTTVVEQPTGLHSDDWPAVGDDKTFADLLQDGSGSANVDDPITAVSNDQEPLQDTDAAWAAALEDDDILIDNEEPDPSSFFGVDDDDFLADDLDAAAPAEPRRTISAYTPSAGTSQASSFLQSHPRSAETPETNLFGIQPFQQIDNKVPARPGLTQTQSFVDKPRGDYQSPYDLPIDVVKPRRRPQAAIQPSQSSMPQPPPRTSSFSVQNHSSVAEPQVTSRPPSSHAQGMPSPALGTPAMVRSASTDANFFADLPVTSKARTRPSGAYTPQPHSLPDVPEASVQRPPRTNGAMAAPPLRPTQSYAPPSIANKPSAMTAALRQPEKAPLFPDHGSTIASQSSPPRQLSSASLVQNRYSPALPATSVSSSPATRYSPAPSDPTGRKSNDRYSSSPSSSSGMPPARQAQPYLPRTSSPLATHGRPDPAQGADGEHVRQIPQYTPGSPGKPTAISLSPELRKVSHDRHPSPEFRKQPADMTGAGTSYSQKSTIRATQPFTPSFAPSISGSSRPYDGHLGSNLSSQIDHPIRLPHRRQFSKDLPYAAPDDARIQDNLQRWKGHPIFQWTDGGLVVRSLPRQTPFYAAGSQGPSIKCTPGDVRITEASQVFTLQDIDLRFPGPLPARSKSKKKELVPWLSEKIALMMQAAQASISNYELSDADRVATEERLVLWRVLQLYLENDGQLDGSPKQAEQVRQILLPDLAQKAQVVELQSPTSGRGPFSGDIIDTAVIAQIRQALFEGRRDDAVRLAEEKRLWGHAMLIASTMDPENFRQIISSFVRNQVKSQGGSEFKSLASLYQVFAGSPEDCVDELVPPSARAGFQMINAADGRGSGETLVGLDKWRETLSLIHSNPTPHNTASILAIGRLLKSYGRLEAAHTCFIFARAMAKHSGSDDVDADFVLLGADAANGATDLDALMLTEMYEFASSFGTPSNQWQYTPHLQAYKLLHGQMLAAHGSKAQAQHYCNHVDSAIKATTRPSGYYHQNFAQELIRFNELLSQSPQLGAGAGGKFFTRPAIGKVSSGMGSWFTKFVSGDEGDADSNASAPGTAEGEVFGPFGGVSASSMPISRTTSMTELQSHMSTPYVPQASIAAGLPSRYTPQAQGSTSKYAPMTSAASVASMDSERSLSLQAPNGMPQADPIRSASSRYAPASAGHSPALLGVQGGLISRRASNQSLVSSGSYEPRPALAEQDGFGYTHSADGSAAVDAHVEGFPPQVAHEAVHNEASEQADYNAEAGGYVPPTMTYESPTADDVDESISASTATIKKKSFMDDNEDDDLAARAAALKISQPSASRDPDPAVLAAAQAEAARDGQSRDNRNSGWFGGWLRKKDSSATPGPVKAKLGEESSFYFDKDLNKWVNKKAGSDSAASAAPTPPPPRSLASAAGTPLGSGPPTRAVSQSMPTSSGPPSRQATPANTHPTNDAQQVRSISSSSNIADTGLGSMGPPPRPASSMSTASSLDDLLGGPGAPRKAGAGKTKKKGGRYVDVMANAK